jgi:PKD repeat protein
MVLAFVEFEDVPDATSYRAEVIREGRDFTEDYGRPPNVDDYQVFWGPNNISVLDTPDGKHWIGPLSAHSVGTGCADAHIGVDGAWTVVRVQAFFDGNLPPIATASADVSGGLTVDFDASDSRDPDGDVVDYLWDFGDETTGSGRETSHRYDQPGPYRVKLTAVDDDDARDDFWLTIEVGGGLVVNSTGDGEDQEPTSNNGICDTGGTVTRDGEEEPECTLRAAIQQANANTGGEVDTISFDVPGAGDSVQIAPSELPALVGPAIVDGTAQSAVLLGGGSGTGLRITGSDVEIRRLSLLSWGEDISFTGSGHRLVASTISGQVTIFDATDVKLGGAPLGDADCADDCNRLGRVLVSNSETIEISGNEVSGIEAAGSQVAVTGNRSDDGQASRGAIQFFASRGVVGGSGALGNRIDSDGVGVRVQGQSSGSVVIAGNDISSGGAGVFVDEEASGVVVGGTGGGNRFGGGPFAVILEGDENVVRGNSLGGEGDGAGVSVSGDANRIGGLAPGEGNEIRGYEDGVKLESGAGNVVAGNLIGLDESDAAQPNDIGIAVNDDVPDTLIEGNVISASTQIGIAIAGNGVAVRGNKVGTDRQGLAARGNRVGIVTLRPAVIEDNLISGNLDIGLVVEAASTVIGNMIGTDASGQAPLGNRIGVALRGAPSQSGTSRVGGLGAGDANTIAFNEAQGVIVLAGSSRIRGNSIHSNGGLGIDLGDDGVTPNDASDGDSGPNGLQNFPVLAGITLLEDGLLVSGRVSGTSSLALYSVDVFTAASCDPSGNGEGDVWGGESPVINPDGDFAAILIESPPEEARYVTAVATGPDGTSEFSQCQQIPDGSAPTLSAAAPAGSTVIEVTSSDGLVGRVVTVGVGQTADHNYGLASGSLVLAKKLRFAHAAGEPVIALDDTLFVSVERARITRKSRQPDVALVVGTLRPVAGRSSACGEDVTVALGDVSERIGGAAFVRKSGNRCVFVASTENGVRRLELDLRKGAWKAEVVRRDLEQLPNPTRVGLALGDDEGAETISFHPRSTLWTYRR